MEPNLKSQKRIFKTAALLTAGFLFFISWPVSFVSAKNFTIYNATNVALPYFSVNGTTGYVGIGTTAPGAKLHVLNTDISWQQTGQYARMGNVLAQRELEFGQVYTTGVDSYPYIQGRWGSTYIQPMLINPYGGTVGIGYTNPGTTGALVINGNVGIGTTTPGKLLDVNGQAIFRNFAYGTTPAGTDLLALSTVEYVNGKTGGSGGVGTGTSGQTLRHNGTGWVANSTLFNDGTNVGIGTTAPGAKLHIAGGHIIVNVADTAFTDGVTDSKNAGFGFKVVGGTNVLGALINTTANGSWGTDINFNVRPPSGGNFPAIPAMVIRSVDGSTGNVGIGTTAPNSKLTIGTVLTGSALGSTLITNAGSLGTTAGNNLTLANIGFLSGNASSLGIRAYRTGAGTQWDTTALAIGMDVDSTIFAGGYLAFKSGNVGIGTTAPGKLLEVNGQAKFNNFAYGTTPVGTDLLALSTVEYVNGKTGGSGGVGAGTSGQTLRHNGTGWVANSTLFNDGTNVGIGTTSLGAKLSIGATSAGTAQLRIENSASLGNYWDIGRDNVSTGDLMFLSGSSEKFRITSGGNVGIGTTAPTVPLEVYGQTKLFYPYSMSSGASAVDLGQTDGTASVTSYALRVYGRNTPSLVVQGNGNVGIGTTTPGKLLEVNGQAKFNNFAYGTTPAGTDTLALTTVEYVNGKTGGSGGVGTGTSGQTLRHNGTGWVANSTLFNDGTNVGIGTTNPLLKLNIVGTTGLPATTGTTQTGGLRVQQASPGTGVMDMGYGTNAAAGAWIQSTDSASLGTYGSLLLNPNGGSVGIGTTNPLAPFHISKSLPTAQTEFRIENTSTTGYGNGITFYSGNTTAAERNWAFFQDGITYGDWGIAQSNVIGGNPYSAGTYRFYINPSGNVGIGTTGPGVYKLNVSSTDYRVANFNSTYGQMNVDFSNSGVGFASIGSAISQSSDAGLLATDFGIGTLGSATNRIIFATGAGYNTRMLISASGNVGIGTTSPGKLLEVNGQAKFNNFAYGTTPVSTDLLALSTVEYVNGKTGGSGGVGTGTSGQTLRHNGTGWVANSTLFNDGTNVGIGTTAPNATLQVANSGNTGSGQFGWLGKLSFELDNIGSYSRGMKGLARGLNIFSLENDSNGGILFTTGTTASPTDRMIILNNGNVGIGTTNPLVPLAVKGLISILDETGLPSTISGFGGLRLSGYNATGTVMGRLYVGDGSGYSFHFAKRTGSVTTDLVTIKDNGNVGIGTTAPNGTLQTHSATDQNLLIRGAISLTDGISIFSVNDANSLTKGMEFAASKYYFNNGNVGIGTSTPGKLLEVNGQAKFNNFAYGTTPAGTDTLALTTVEYVNGKTGGSGGVGTGTSGQTLRHNGTGWVANSTLFNDGTNVGIGTTNPLRKLVVSGPDDGNGQLRLMGTFDTVRWWDIGRESLSTGRFKINEYNNGTETERLTILMGGNVGIGTTNPQYALDVNGQFRATGNAFFDAGTFVKDQNSTIDSMWGWYAWDKEFQFNKRTLANVFVQNIFTANWDTGNLALVPTAGNVGIGTTAPNRKLEITTDAGLTSPAGIRMSFDPGSANYYGEWAQNYLGAGKGFQYNFNIRDNYGTANVVKTAMSIYQDGNVGIGTTTPGKLLEVNGQAKFNNLAYGTTPVGTDLLALATVEYVNGVTGGGTYLPIAGGTMTGSIAMGNNNISNVNTLTVTKINATTIDPLYSLNGVNYATFAASIAGGVKEECLGKIKINRLAGREYESVIDFSNIAQGSDLWVWRRVVDFNFDNVEVSITPYGKFAQVYYLIEGNKLIFRSDRPVEISYRLTGKRFDWRQWPTKPLDQSETGVKVE